MEARVIAFTGHRPNKLPGGYDSDHEELCIEIIKRLIEEKISHVIVGGALGIDQIAMRAARFAGCYVTLIEPFPGFWNKWPVSSIEDYMQLKYSFDEGEITIIHANENEKYEPWKMQQRNQMMVDRATEVWAYWDGSSGGTANCVKYALDNQKIVRNLYDELNPQNQV